MTSRIINRCAHPNEIRPFTIARPPALPTVLAGSVLLQIGPELTDQVRVIQQNGAPLPALALHALHPCGLGQSPAGGRGNKARGYGAAVTTGRRAH
jgi:hypothetical protein